MLSLQQINNNPKQRPPSDHHVKIDHDSKHFAIGTFLNHFVVKRANDDLCYWKEPSGQTNSKLTSTFLSWQVWQPKPVAQFFSKIAIMLEKYYYKNCLKDCLVKTWHCHCLVQCIKKQKLGHNYHKVHTSMIPNKSLGFLLGWNVLIFC